MEEDFSQAYKSARRKMRQQARDLKRSYLRGVTSHRERRRIKELADEARDRAIFDLTTEYKANPNKTDYESDIQQRGIDQFIPPEATEKDEVGIGGGGGGGIPNGYTEEILDVVDAFNSAGQRTFLTKPS